MFGIVRAFARYMTIIFGFVTTLGVESNRWPCWMWMSQTVFGTVLVSTVSVSGSSFNSTVVKASTSTNLLEFLVDICKSISVNEVSLLVEKQDFHHQETLPWLTTTLKIVNSPVFLFVRSYCSFSLAVPIAFETDWVSTYNIPQETINKVFIN